MKPATHPVVTSAGRAAHGPARPGERGSALVLAILVSVVLTLLGVSFLMMSRTENLIAENEKLAAQAHYVAEAGARAVKRWFDEPGTAPMFPDTSVADRDLRRVDADGAGPLPPGGVGADPDYKQSSGQLFDRPYRGSIEDTLLGTDDNPDVRIDDAAFLSGLIDTLLPGYPDPKGEIVARFATIDVYGPPYVETAPGAWTRFGVGTVKVVAQIVKTRGPTGEQVLAETEIRATLNEAPYGGSFGPLHSGGPLEFDTAGTPWPVHWGPVTAREGVTVSAVADLPNSLPRSVIGLPRDETVWGFGEDFQAYKTSLPPGLDLGDPWFRVVAGGSIVAPLVPPDAQPFPSGWSGWSAANPPPGPHADQSGVFQNVFVGCPQYPYGIWKRIAISGENGVRYFAWDPGGGGDSFRENGRGPSRTFRQITDGQSGVFFFDTQDGRPPEDRNSDGILDDSDNLTPAITVSGGQWAFRGVIYLNATRFQADVAAGSTASLEPPGEPYEDLDGDGEFDNGGETWIDLVYPTTLADPFVVDDAAPSERRVRGPALGGTPVAFQGILYLTGQFEATGSARYYGSVIARRGVVQRETTAGVPEIYWDESIIRSWPPIGWGLPRVIISGWSARR